MVRFNVSDVVCEMDVNVQFSSFISMSHYNFINQKTHIKSLKIKQQ